MWDTKLSPTRAFNIAETTPTLNAPSALYAGTTRGV